MSAETPGEIRPAQPNGFSAWRGLVWAALTLFIFNFWAIGLRHWPGVLDYEVPGRATLLAGHGWTLLSYALIGSGTGTTLQWLSGPLSLFFLVIAAQLAEGELTRRDFTWLCAACALGGAAFWLPLHWSGGESLLAGSAVLVLGLGTFLCFALPNEPMPLHLFFAFEVRPQAFFWLVLALESGAFISFELPQALGHPGIFQANFDYSAHLGAMLAGWACARYWRNNHPEEDELEPLLAAQPKRAQAVPVAAARSKLAADAVATKPTMSNQRELREAVDRILDKINTQGFASLNAQEIQTLDHAKVFFKK